MGELTWGLRYGLMIRTPWAMVVVLAAPCPREGWVFSSQAPFLTILE